MKSLVRKREDPGAQEEVTSSGSFERLLNPVLYAPDAAEHPTKQRFGILRPNAWFY
jgi:hypothetical protein